MNANDKSWSNETIALFDKLETQIRQQQAEIEALKKAFKSVCDGMQTSLELNKAQANRYWSEQ